MKRNRRLVPYVLVGILTLGTGLAIGFGLSKGPVTYTASAEVTGIPCSALPNGAAGMTCSGNIVVWFGPHGRKFSKGSINCVVDGVNGAKAAGHNESASLAAVEAAVNVLLPECEKDSGSR